jgi:NADH-quinone oxidoreductase subunit N
MNALIFSAICGLVMMFSGIITQKEKELRGIALSGFLLLMVLTVLELGSTLVFNVEAEQLLNFDQYGLVFSLVLLGVTFLYLLLSGGAFAKVGEHVAEYYALLFFIFCGITIITSFSSLLMLFLGIEIISIPLYILTGSDKRNLKSNEAALKYFLMGSFSTGLMVMGIAFLYGASGSFQLDRIGLSIEAFKPLLAAGVLLLLFSMSFKVSAAPFHFWTPDVYDGAPTVFTSFMATIVKAAAFFGFIRLFQGAFGAGLYKWQLLAAIITAATLLFGNITAVYQQSVKRMLAYSSIAQAGFMLFALVSTGAMAREGLLFYAAAYSAATIGVFAVLIKMKDYTLQGFCGLAQKQPLIAGVTTVFLLSLAGIPATAGFLAKFYMISAAMQTGKLLWLVVLAICCAAIGVYYYFRIIQAMYFKEGDAEMEETSIGFKWVLVLLAAAIVYLGLYPQQLVDLLYTPF